MAIIKCKMCGGDLNLVEGSGTAECEYCGTLQTVPKIDDEKKLTLFARANRLRAACEFDKAAGIYESIVADFPEEAEAYWGLVLCKYGIEYVDDPGTGKKVPTCHRSSFDSVMEDSNFDQAQENADVVAQKVYREEAKQFERIRKGILEVSATEEPYDIFICYKETDSKGDRTVDSVLAQDLYSALTDKGYRVFFSRITLQSKLGEAYEPYIFAALNSAKVMLAVGTCYEHYNAVWVKNEWGRYLKICEADKSKHLIPCYKDLDPEDMPKEFNHLQGADLGKMGAIQDILFNMEKYIPLKKQTETVKETVVVQSAQTGQQATSLNYVKRGRLALEDGDYSTAERFFNDALNLDAECAEAYLGLAMCEKKVVTLSALVELEDWNARNYKRAKQFAAESLKAQIVDLENGILDAQKRKNEYLATVRERIEPFQNLLAVGVFHLAAAKMDGTVVADLHPFDETDDVGQCDVEDWRDIVAVSSDIEHTVGLKSDGTVVVTEYAGKSENYCGQGEVDGWCNIVAVSAGNGYTVGLKADGTVVATKYLMEYYGGQCDVNNWRNIVAVSAGDEHAVGLRADGTVVATQYLSAEEYYTGQCEVGEWRDVVAISAGANHTVGLRADGTVVATRYTGTEEDYCGQCDVSEWRDIVAISAKSSHTVGLRANGTVVATKFPGESSGGRCDVSRWRDIVAISANGNWTMGLKADGTVVVTGLDDGTEMPEWKLFSNMEMFEQDRELAIQQRKEIDREEAIKENIIREAENKRQEEERKRVAAWRNAGKCQHCGGELKGLFTKKCAACGKPKDY